MFLLLNVCYNRDMTLILFPFPSEPILTLGQIERIANILDGAGQVILGVMVVSPLIGGFDKVDMSVVVLGFITLLFCWTMSIRLARIKDISPYDV